MSSEIRNISKNVLTGKEKTLNTVNTLKKMILEFQISSQKMDLTFPISSSVTSNAAAAEKGQNIYQKNYFKRNFDFPN